MTCCIHPTSLYITPDEATVSFLTDTNTVGMGAVEELRLSYCKSRVDWLLLLTHATSLRRLYIDVEAIAPERLGTALKASLSSLAKLEELEIGWTVDGRPHGVNQHAALVLFLTALPSPSSISLIKIEYIFQSNTHPEQGTDFWDEADAALCNRRMFPKLKQLEVEIFFLDPRNMPPEEKYEEIKERFWLATRRAGVLVNISVT
ncbi:hypothetical protein BKA70DRAFT_504344 [Coprinopsis sp. MPI-PUGE-AT-0042]|nr:hypothetical protein BKA70DRAFT_504344 [Coprinopsis sp. MPI-PUGE-AT-0042]